MSERFFVCGVGGWLLLLACVCDGQFVAPEGADYHNGSTLPLAADEVSRSLLQRLENALATASGDEVANVVASMRARARLVGRPDADLVPLGARTHVPVLEKALRLVNQRAPEAVRLRIEQETLDLIAEAVRFRDLAALLALATRNRALEASRTAAMAAARLLFEQGRWWECMSLARRAGDAPGAAQLVLSAQARVPQPEDKRHEGPWQRRFTFSRPDDLEAEAIPFFSDGRPGEVLVQDVLGLHGLNLRETGDELSQTFESFFWGEHVPGLVGARRSLPAPRQQMHATQGDRVVTSFNLPNDRRDWTRRSPPTDRRARLVAIDLGQGSSSLAWDAEGPDVPESTAFGPVHVVGDRVFVQLFRVGLETEVSLMAFRLSDGALLFETPLVRGASIPRFASRQAKLDEDELDKRAREGTVAERSGVVYACTGFGVVAAVDGVTGLLQHTFRYDRLFSLDRSVYDRSFLFDTGGWNHEPVRLARERVVVAPSDSRFLYFLALEPGPEGQLMLEDPIERLDRGDVVALLPREPGGTADVLVTRLRDNRSSLVRLSANGSTLAASPPLPVGELQSGRPIQLGGQVLMPTTAGLRVFRPEELEAPPTLLPQVEGLPPVRSLHATAAGLIGVAPDPSLGRLDIPLVQIVYWQGLP